MYSFAFLVILAPPCVFIFANCNMSENISIYMRLKRVKQMLNDIHGEDVALMKFCCFNVSDLCRNSCQLLNITHTIVSIVSTCSL